MVSRYFFSQLLVLFRVHKIILFIPLNVYHITIYIQPLKSIHTLCTYIPVCYILYILYIYYTYIIVPKCATTSEQLIVSKRITITYGPKRVTFWVKKYVVAVFSGPSHKLSIFHRFNSVIHNINFMLI